MHHRTTLPQGEAPQTAGKLIRWARYYDAVSWLLSFGQIGRIRRLIIEAAELAPGEKVLDVGCGTGTLAIAAKAKAGPAGEVQGIDASPEMIQVARRKATRAGADVGFQVGLIEELPFDGGRFDLVTSTMMLHHLPEDLKRKGLAEVRRVLKPESRLLVVDFASQPGSFVGLLASLLPGHGRDHSGAARIKAMLGDAGFRDVEQLPTKYRQLMFVRARP